MGLATAVWMPFVIGALALSVAGGSMGLLFAAVRDELSRTGSPAAARVISAVRMAFTAGWILGPVVGSWFGAVYGLRPLLLATAVLTVAQILPLGFQRVPRYVSPTRTLPLDAASRDGGRGPRGGLSTRATGESKVPLLFVGCCVLVMHSDTIKFAYLPLYMANQLGISDTLRGR